MAKPAKQSANSDAAGCAVIVGILVLLVFIGKCSGGSPEMNALELMNVENADLGNAIAAQTPPPIEPLNAAGVSRGASHLRLAFGAEGFSGVMIYSQNCYDALGHSFSWPRLDQCGGFDMLAARSIDSADTATLASEAAYFQREAAATRYLAAATGAGEPASEADARLSQLQAKVASLRIVRASAPSASDTTGNLNGSDEGEEGEELAANLAEEDFSGE